MYAICGSQTALADAKHFAVADSNVHYAETDTEEKKLATLTFIENMMAKQKLRALNTETELHANKCCVILCDVGSDEEWMNSSQFFNLVNNGRFIGVTIILEIQYMLQLRPNLRLCINEMYLSLDLAEFEQDFVINNLIDESCKSEILACMALQKESDTRVVATDFHTVWWYTPRNDINSLVKDVDDMTLCEPLPSSSSSSSCSLM